MDCDAHIPALMQQLLHLTLRKMPLLMRELRLDRRIRRNQGLEVGRLDSLDGTVAIAVCTLVRLGFLD